MLPAGPALRRAAPDRGHHCWRRTRPCWASRASWPTGCP